MESKYVANYGSVINGVLTLVKRWEPSCNKILETFRLFMILLTMMILLV